MLSLYVFLGPYGQKTAHYWRIVSPLALLCFCAQLHVQLNYFRNIAGVLAFMFLLLACFTGRHP
jgi:hypothetical protein